MMFSYNEKPISRFFTIILFRLRAFIFYLFFPWVKNNSFINYCPGIEAVVIIVVSLPCTTYQWGAFIVLCPYPLSLFSSRFSFKNIGVGAYQRASRLLYTLQMQTSGVINHFTTNRLISFCLLTICSLPLAAQDTIIVKYKRADSISGTIKPTLQDSIGLGITNKPATLNNAALNGRYQDLSPRQRKARIRLATIANVTGYSAILAGLSTAWYSNYKQTSFHTFNDNREWMQIDKVGHTYGAYIESRTSMELWRWTGIERKKRIWYGGLSGVAYQTIIETLDGFSAGWGWSWGDIGSNILGSGTMIAQELAWDDQRIKLKFSYHNKDYGDPQLTARADQLYGSGFAEKFVKEYNAHTFWASANLRSFLPKSNLPPWLAVAVGYGAEGMFGANENVGKAADGTTNFDRRDIKRYRQWYLAPDIDLTKIKTNKKGLRFLFTVLSAFKFPAPGLELSNGKLKVKAIVF